jgi:L-cysteine:1D-myo-inositol 2-amino-2-deoxy-alpha-D-glucopyranoside ligase
MMAPWLRMQHAAATDQAAPQLRSAGLRLGGRPLPMVYPARMYLCGITPYDVTHLGHAATFVWADTVRSVLRLAQVDMVVCRNVTDVDDVLTEAAVTRGRRYDEFALHQEYLFDRDMAALRVHAPAHEPHARRHVTQVQQLAAALLAAGRAYHRDGHVYFRGADVPFRVGLDRGRARSMCAAFGDQPDDPLREDPFDVPVWRHSTADEPAWPSPWGPGRPGWHAECAAMAMSVLGTGVDILAGGAELAFPHHAYQTAMVEAAASVAPFARGRLHVGTVHRDGVKMAKSTGNLVLVTDLLHRFPPAAVRLLILDRVWHQPWEYRPADVDRAAGALDDLYAAAGRPGRSTGAVVEALLDDLDVPRALAVAREEGGDAARLLIEVLSLA